MALGTDRGNSGSVASEPPVAIVLTLSDAPPDLPAMVALIVAWPAATVDTKPFADTVATDVFELAHVGVPPATVVPPASLAVAVACVLWPTLIAALASVTRTVATVPPAGLIVIGSDPVTPSTVALMTADPAVSAVTIPVCDTDATDGAELDQVIVRPARGVP